MKGTKDESLVLRWMSSDLTLIFVVFVCLFVFSCIVLFYFVFRGLPKPTLRAVPNNVVTIGNEVTIICEDPSNAQEYPLYIKGYPDSQLTTSH